MSVLAVVGSLVLLMALIGWLKWHPFLAFLVTALVAGLALGLPMTTLPLVLKKGVGNMMGEIVVVIVAGALLGKLIAVSGAAQNIAESFTKWMGPQRVQWALLFTGFLVGIPLFYNVGFVLLVPLAFAVIYQNNLPPLFTAMPMLAALSVTHGFLPPHPSPMAIGAQLGAHTGKVMLYGMVVAIPAVLLAGPLFALRFKKFVSQPLTLFQPSLSNPFLKPPTITSFAMALLPALALAVGLGLSQTAWGQGPLGSFFNNANMVLLACLVLVLVYVALVQKIPPHTLLQYQGDAIKDIAGILLIIAGAGALKEVFVESQVSVYLAQSLSSLSLNPLVLGWLMAALVRVCVGSATVAGLTTAGLMAPMSTVLSYDPNLMVLSIGAGSLFLSHINDSGFWMFKEYFNLSVKDTLRTWTLMECVVSVVGLLGVLCLQVCLQGHW